MQTFLQYVARDILAKHPDGLNDIAIVFPNKRASLFFNQALYEANGQTLWSPAYLTISDLFRRHSQWEVPDQMLLVFKLYNIFCEVTGSDETLDHFYSWGQLLLADFDDVDKNLADADKLFVNLEAWQELKDFSFLTDTQKKSLEAFFGKVMDQTEMQRRFIDLWRHLKDIYHAFRKHLEDEGLAYEGMLYRQVAYDRNIEFRYKTYIFVGFNLLQKVEQQLFQRLKEEGRAEFYWDYDEYYIRPGQEAGRYISRVLERFPNELSRTRISAPMQYDDVYKAMSAPKDIAYISAPTESIQARYVAQWLKENDRIKAGSRTAIVLCDENLLETVIHCLPEEVENVNITTGFPLASSPAGTLVNALLNLRLKGMVERSDKFRLKYINPVLRHPYAKYISEDCAILAEELNSKKHYFPNRALLTNGYDEALADLFAELRPVGGRWPLLSWVAGILKRVGIGSREDNNPLLHESVFRMYTLINRLDEIMTLNADDSVLTATNIDEDTGKQIVSVSILQRLLSQVIQSTSIPFHGEPLLGIQVMGVLETRNLDFDHVLMLSCNEDNLPKGVNDASFIPHSIRAGYELTTVENKIAIYAYYFHSLIQRAGDITMTYNNSTDDGQRGEMSRFMLQYMVENARRQSIKYQTLLSEQNVTPIQRHPIGKDERVLAKLENLQTLSPSAINRYLRCPLQFYYNTVCRLREADNEDEEEIDNRTFGNIFHSAAEQIYRYLSNDCTRPISADNIARLQKDHAKTEAFIDQAFREKLFKVENPDFHPEYNGLQRINKKVIRLYVERMLALDKELAPIDILALEDSYYDNMAFEIEGKTHHLVIGGQVDRLDCVTRNGKKVIRVVDYKTGSPLTTLPANIEEIFSSENIDKKHTSYYLQAFLYSGIIRRGSKVAPKVNPDNLPVAPALLFIRQATKQDYDPTLSLAPARGKRTMIEDIDMVYDEFAEALRNLIIEIYHPTIPFHPTNDSERCLNCPYNKICGL